MPWLQREYGANTMMKKKVIREALIFSHMAQEAFDLNLNKFDSLKQNQAPNSAL